MESITDINARLKSRFGCDPLGRPNYRLVWSTGETEKRLGTFTDYFGMIYLRTVTEVREVPKYPNNPDRFALEFLLRQPPPSEVKNYNFYEPIFVFEQQNGTPLEPVWRAIEFIIYMHRYPVRKTAADIEDEFDAQLEKERLFYLDYLNDTGSAFGGALKHGEGVVVPEMPKEKSNV